MAFCHDPGGQHEAVCTNLVKSSSPYLEGNRYDILPLLFFPQNLRFLSVSEYVKQKVGFYFCVRGIFLSLLLSLNTEILEIKI